MLSRPCLSQTLVPEAGMPLQVRELQAKLDGQAHSHQLAQEALAIEEKCSRDKMQAQVRRDHKCACAAVHACMGFCFGIH